MAVSERALDAHLRTVRRIAEHREYEAEKKMLEDFTECYTDIREFLGVEYAKYAEDDRLTYDILQKKGEYARFCEEVINKYEGITPKCYDTVNSLVNDTYELCYKGMADAVAKSKRVEDLADALKSIKAVTPETIKRSVENPIPKLRLDPVMQRSRKKVIAGIKREITIGLSQGDRMSTMAKRITDKVKIGCNQSMLIARTEAHRVREGGFNDAASSIDDTLKDSNSKYRLVKVWKTMRDARVRDTGEVSHVQMQGQTVLQDEDFVMVLSGATAPVPGQSGVAAEDCNCRCYASRDIMDDAEFFAATGRHFPEYEEENTAKAVDKSAESDIINVKGDAAALENQRYGRNKDTLVNKTYIESGEYKRKFDNISENQEVNKTLYSCAKTALKHRSGTKFEDMYWIDGDTGKIIAKATDEKHESGIINSASRNKLLSKYKNVCAIHTHPQSMPPSAADFNSFYSNGYKCGYIACHNGKVFGYVANEEIDERLCNSYIKNFVKNGCSEFEAQLNALKKIKEVSDIDFWEVK